jgi:hypothetical protein
MTFALAARRRSATRPDALASAALRALGGFLLAALAGFHAWLLGVHLLTGEAFEPTTAVRWALAALVLAGFRTLSRRGLPLFFGRRAVGLWLLVVVIHASAAWDGGGIAFGAALPESVTALAQLSAFTAVLGALLVAAVAARSGLFAARRAGRAAPALVAGLPSTGFVLLFSPRPPPLA